MKYKITILNPKIIMEAASPILNQTDLSNSQDATFSQALQGGTTHSERVRRGGRGDGHIESEDGRVITKAEIRGKQHSPWDDYVLIFCADGKQKRIKSGLMPLVNGLPRGVVQSGDISLSEVENTAEARVMRIKGYGNSIVPQLAAEFIRVAVL